MDMVIRFLNSLIGRYNDSQVLDTGGIKAGKLQKLVQRDRFSPLLPYDIFCSDQKYWQAADDCISFVFECVPLTYASRKTYDNLKGVLDTLPFESVLQTTIVADNFVEPLLKRYSSLRTGQHEDNLLLADNVVKQYRNASNSGFANMGMIPARNFRVFVSVKLPVDEFTDQQKFIRDAIFNALTTARLNPTYVTPGVLCPLLQRLFNDEENVPDPNVWKYNPNIAVKNQIILGGTKTNFKDDHIELGDSKIATIQTVNDYPYETLNDLTINKVFGRILGHVDDVNQCTFPFLCTVNFVMCDLKKTIHVKTEASMIQKKSGSTAKFKQNKEQEYKDTAQALDKGERYVRVIPIILTLAKDLNAANENKAKINALWKREGFTLNHERGSLLSILFLMALPLGFYNLSNIITFLERDRLMPAESAARFMTVQGDFSGIGKPVTLLTGRKGQIVPIDIFDENLAKKNGIIAAATGSGKSYLANRLIEDMSSVGTIIRIFDLGRSYKKLCRLKKGNFLEFTRESNENLNPFTFATEESLPSIKTVIEQMIWSSSGNMPTETQSSIVKAAVSKVWKDHGNDGNPTHVQKVLQNFKSTIEDYGEGFDDSAYDGINKISVELAFNMSDFTTGPYAQWFNGKSTLDISSDEFVVLELDDLKHQPDLFNVVVVQIINYMSTHLYQGTRARPIFNLFDEAWQWADDKSLIGESIAAGYRLARKYYGAFFTVFQSLQDLEKFGKHGSVIKVNSAWKFLLMANDYTDACERKLLDLDPFMLEMAKSVRLVKGFYSEVLIQSDLCEGVARLPNDRFSHLVATSDPKDNQLILHTAEQRGVSELQAIALLAGGSS